MGEGSHVVVEQYFWWLKLQQKPYFWPEKWNKGFTGWTKLGNLREGINRNYFYFEDERMQVSGSPLKLRV